MRGRSYRLQGTQLLDCNSEDFARRRRREVVEPVWGVLKEQRGMRRFRMRGMAKVAAEFAFAATALNLTRLWRLRPSL